jgi:hypothetical protein
VTKPAAGKDDDDDGFGSFTAPPAAKPAATKIEDDDGFGSFTAPPAAKPAAAKADDDEFGDFEVRSAPAKVVAAAPAPKAAPAAARVQSSGPRTDLTDAVRACGELFGARSSAHVLPANATEGWHHLQQQVKANMEKDSTWRPLKCTTCSAPLFSFASVCVNCGTVRSLGLLATPAAQATVPFVGTAVHAAMVTSLKLPRALAEATARPPTAEEEAIRKAAQPIATRHAPPARPIPEALLRKAAATPPKPKPAPSAAPSTPSLTSSLGHGLDLLAQPAPADQRTASTGSVAPSSTVSPADALARSSSAAGKTTQPSIGLDDDPFGAPRGAAPALTATPAVEAKTPAPSISVGAMFKPLTTPAAAPVAAGGMDALFSLPPNPIAAAPAAPTAIAAATTTTTAAAAAADPFASFSMVSPVSPVAPAAPVVAKQDPFADFLLQSPVAPAAPAVALPDLSFMK